jgi:hypothetical protein
VPQLQQLLAELGDYTDEQGRVYSPFVDRGVANIPVVVPIPDSEQLAELGTADTETLNAVLERYRLVNTPDTMLQAQTKYLERFNATAGTDLYDTQLQELKAGMEGRILLGQSRRVSQRYGTLVATDGNLDSEVIYINEGEEPCEGCEPLGGTVGKLRDLIAEGIEPAAQCLGGDLCLCDFGVFG